MPNNYEPQVTDITRQTVYEYPKILHSVLLEGNNMLYQGLIPNITLLPVRIYELSKCITMNLTPRCTPNAYVVSKERGYEINFSAGLVFSALEMAFVISAFLHPESELDYVKLAKKLKSRLTDCSEWKKVKGYKFAFLNDRPLHASLQKVSPFCPRHEKDLKEVFSLLFPTILFSVALHERSHIMWGHLRLEKESRLNDEKGDYQRICRALELHADISGVTALCAYLSYMGASREKMKIAGYCILGALIIMHYAQQENNFWDYHPRANVRYVSIRNVLSATDEAFHVLPLSVAAPVIEGLTELAMFYDDYHLFGATFDLFHDAFWDWTKISTTVSALVDSPVPSTKDHPSIRWEQFFQPNRFETKAQRAIKEEGKYLLSMLLKLVESKLRPYSEDVLNPATWKQNDAVSWIGDERGLE